jgi:hypothetical protein
MDDQHSSDSQMSAATPSAEPEPSPEQKNQERLEYLKRVVPPRKPKKGWPKWVGAGLLVIIVVGIVTVVIAGHKNSGSKPPAAKAATVQVPPSQTSSSTGTNDYVAKGNDLNLSFNYPSNWSATPVSGSDTTDQPITITSPLVSMTSAAGQNVTGKVIFSIRPGSATMSELSSATTAAQGSVQYAYTKPASDQHQYFYLTFVHNVGAANPAGSFNEVIVTGITNFSSGDSLAQGSISVDPIISASFDSCSTSACTGSGTAPLSITNATWQNANIFTQTLNTIESLQLN